MKVSITDLARLTGLSSPTVRKRLQPLDPLELGKQNRIIFDSVKALPLIYNPNGDDGGKDSDARTKADLEAELIAVRIKKEEIKIAVMEGKLVQADTVNQKWGKIATAFQRQALAFPDRVAQLLETASGYKATVAILKQEIETLLTKLSDGKL